MKLSVPVSYSRGRSSDGLRGDRDSSPDDDRVYIHVTGRSHVGHVGRRSPRRTTRSSLHLQFEW